MDSAGQQTGIFGSPGEWVFDGFETQCHRCGFTTAILGEHIEIAHELDAEEYREMFGFARFEPLVGGVVAEGGIVGNMGRTRTGQARAKWDGWNARLLAVGWDDWDQATAWAESRGYGWRDIAGRLGISHQSARTQATGRGAQLRRPADFLVDAARAHYAEHGTLHTTTGKLGVFIKKKRFERRNGVAISVTDQLDAIDPDWMLSESERAEVAAERGEEFTLGARKPMRETWPVRLRKHGWSNWEDAIVWAAAHQVGWAELADMVDSRSEALRTAAQAELGTDHPNLDARLEPLRRSRIGHLAAANGHLQCHVCALWFVSLGLHTTTHGLTAKEYRRKFATGQARLIAEGAAANENTLDWDHLFEQVGLTDWDGAATWAAANNVGWREVARRINVPLDRVRAEARNRGLRIPTTADKHLKMARAHVAAGRSLAEAPPEMRAWLNHVRTREHDYVADNIPEQLDEIDPDWRLTKVRLAAKEGAAFAPTAVGSDAQQNWRTAIGSAGFADTAAVLRWASEYQASYGGIGWAIRLPETTVRHYLREIEKVDLVPRPGPARTQYFAGGFRMAELHLRNHGNLASPTGELRFWLQENLDGTLKNPPWVQWVLDRMDPDWRKPYA